MLVTLDKGAASFTERTRYRDYATSPSEFHWQSPAATHQQTKDGKRILDVMKGRGQMWLFVRDTTGKSRSAKSERVPAGRKRSPRETLGTTPYVFLGAFLPREIRGDRPMSVTGDLANAMPAEWFEVAARAR